MRHEGIAVALCEDARSRRCPNCRQRYADFDGCAAVRCDGCGAYFCGLCTEGFHDDSAAAHAHVKRCSGMGTFYVPQEVVHRTWIARARRKMTESLATVRARDGRLVEWSTRRAVRRIDPDLLERQTYTPSEWLSAFFLLLVWWTFAL